jgi:hypothetical protein
MRALSDSAEADGHSVIYSIDEILRSGLRPKPPPLPAKRKKVPEKPWVCSPFLVSPPLSAFVEKPPLPPPRARATLTRRSKKLLALAASFALVGVSGIAAATVGGDRVPRPSRARATIEIQTLSIEGPTLEELEPYVPEPDVVTRPRVTHHAVASRPKDEGFTRLSSHADLAPNPF